ncbi:hypothetical protein PV08_00767 [Exophiala spinifera]|uniref:Alpha/beta hydrolase fold-3 domain-containing protein n=1 Tax=Exophiala spinifera TaxID=91928 RepID=A0A0D2A5Y1_9EURO|nr:uncharacterized protein PV08_00767 [Exophiala spinifera]KIW20192.1 hypothetical protein PV08_00767 [Exophiala spinifera]
MSPSHSPPRPEEHSSTESYDMTEAKDFARSKSPDRLRVPKSHSVTFSNIAEFQSASNVDPPETMLAETFTLEPFSRRPRSMSHHLSSKDIPSRKALTLRARFWRFLMTLGMHFHDWAPPRAPRPSFKHEIPTDTIPIELYFYLPPRYHGMLDHEPDFRFPAVINFHGGGFCLGDARDDRYWARVVMEYTNAIFISVNYRRAPEHPFPIPVDDCVEAILYVAEHAVELHIDQSNIALSGFSAGANLAFSAPFRLSYHRNLIATTHDADSRPTTAQTVSTMGSMVHDDSDTEANDHDHDHDLHDHETYNFVTPVQSTSNLVQHRTRTPLQIRSIVAWYPLLDWTMSRSRKIRESRNPKKCLPKTFTDLFDFSYLPPPDVVGDHCSPYASPGLAHDHMIHECLPQDIQMWLCEWDMLLREGQVFADRLERLGKNIDSKLIPRVPHGWDKSPNPFRDQKAVDFLYTKSAINLNKVFQNKDGLGPGNSMSSLHPTDSIIERQPRRSIVLPL